jgi:lactoylglutathione lyase
MSKRALVILSILLVATVWAHQSGVSPEKGERMYNKITVNMMVDSVNQTLDFYEQVLGFKLVMGVPENSQQVVTTRDVNTPLGFAIIKYHNVELMLQSQESLSKELPVFKNQPVGGSVTLYIEVARVKKLYENLKDKVTILKDLHATFYGKQEFYIRDCNGYVLTFASSQ